MKAPPCEFCGRRDTSFTSLWVRAQRMIRKQRGQLKELRHLLAISRACQATSAEELIDANAEVRRLNAMIDFLAIGRTRAMEQGNG